MIAIPDEAMPVVEILRRDVERPTGKIIQIRAHPRLECGACLMALHPTALALTKTPTRRESFASGPMHDLDVDNFYHFASWWDHLTIPQAYEALDLIWPPKEER